MTPIPVTILGGFLGAGKTTVLNHVLQGRHGRRVGVIVNDFGAVNIDAKLVIAVEGDTIALANGCVCCSLRDDFMDSMRELLDRPRPPEHVVIEASGVSDPAAIARGFDEPGLRDLVRLDAVLVVVDAEQHLQMRTADRIVAAGQLRRADVVILNKVDLVDASTLQALEAKIRKMLPRARIYRTSFGQVAPKLFFGLGFDPQRDDAAPVEVHVHEAGHAHHHTHEPDDVGHAEFETWRYASEAPLSSRRLRRFVDGLPPSVFRAKGVVRLVKDRGHKAILHVVGRRAELQLAGPWGDEPPRSELVFIGAPGALEPAALEEQLRGCQEGDGDPGESGLFRWVRRMWNG